jgi:hypothetical protein
VYEAIRRIRAEDAERQEHERQLADLKGRNL